MLEKIRNKYPNAMELDMELSDNCIFMRFIWCSTMYMAEQRRGGQIIIYKLEGGIEDASE